MNMLTGGFEHPYPMNGYGNAMQTGGNQYAYPTMQTGAPMPAQYGGFGGGLPQQYNRLAGMMYRMGPGMAYNGVGAMPNRGRF